MACEGTATQKLRQIGYYLLNVSTPPTRMLHRVTPTFRATRGSGRRNYALRAAILMPAFASEDTRTR